MTKTLPVVADITLYGNSRTGAGWLALVGSRLLGTGDPKADRSFTEAVGEAAAALNEAGAKRGLIRIFAPCGERVAVVRNDRLIPTFGDLVWGPAPVYQISTEAIEAAAERS